MECNPYCSGGHGRPRRFRVGRRQGGIQSDQTRSLVRRGCHRLCGPERPLPRRRRRCRTTCRSRALGEGSAFSTWFTWSGANESALSALVERLQPKKVSTTHKGDICVQPSDRIRKSRPSSTSLEPRSSAAAPRTRLALASTLSQCAKPSARRRKTSPTPPRWTKET